MTTTGTTDDHNNDHEEEKEFEKELTGFDKFKAFMFKWIFPIYKHEYIKILPVILMMLSALFVYTIYRDIKDAMIFGEERQSLVTVQWCKVLVMIVALPVATIFFKLANVVSREFIFYQTVLFFAAYFMFNAFLLYPGRAVIHARSAMIMRRIDESFEDQWATALIPLAGLVLFPINTCHYLASELWGTISVSFLLWGYVNQITPKDAAKRYYGVLGLGAQLGPLLAGQVVGWITNATGKGVKAFLSSLVYLNIASLIFMVIFAGGFAFMSSYVMKLDRFKPKPVVSASGKATKKSKPKMGVMGAIKYCFTNSYVLALGGLVFAYGWCMVVGELSYKDVMKLTTDGDQNAYSDMKGIESKASAALAMILMTFVSHNIIRLCGWKITALLAPMICTLTAALFYCWVLFSSVYTADSEDTSKFEAVNPGATVGMWLGLLFAVATKATKYASFDPAKELAYLPLTSEEKYKAKAAVDIVGARFGKGGAALFNIFILNWALGCEFTFVKSAQWTSFMAVIVMMVIWVASTLYLGSSIKKKEQEKQMKNAMDIQVHSEKNQDGPSKQETTA